MKPCIACAHFRHPFLCYETCARDTKQDPVTGRMYEVQASAMVERMNTFRCGPDAKFFVPKTKLSLYARVMKWFPVTRRKQT